MAQSFENPENRKEHFKTFNEKYKKPLEVNNYKKKLC